MTIVQRLWRVEIAAICALIGVAAVIGLGLALRDLYLAESGSGAGAVMIVGATLTFVVGLLPVAFYGAPIFAWYISGDNLPRWLLYILAALPGVILGSLGVGWVGVAAGIMVAGLLELISLKWPSLAKQGTAHE